VRSSSSRNRDIASGDYQFDAEWARPSVSGSAAPQADLSFLIGCRCHARSAVRCHSEASLAFALAFQGSRQSPLLASMAGSAVSQSDHRSVFHTLKRRLPFGQFCQRNRDWADGLLARRYAEADREIPMIVGNARRQRERQALQ